MPNLPKQPKPQNPAAIRQAWADERTAARQARADGDPFREFHHLERAHILSQPFAVLHVRTHVAMLGFGIRNRDRREVTGQLLRLLVAGPGIRDAALPARQHRRRRRQRRRADGHPHRPPGRPRPGRCVMNATVTDTVDHHRHSSTTTRAIGWGVGIGAAQAAIALAFWWLPLSTVHALMITLIAAVYVGFAVSDGRTRVIAVEVAVVVAFFIAAAAAVSR